MSDEEKILIENVRDSNRISFKTLFNRYHDQLFRFVVYKVQDADTAKDITQETFLRVWKKGNHFNRKNHFFTNRPHLNQFMP